MPYWFDGNNLIGQSAAAAQSDSRVRQAFLYSLSSYRKAGGGRFLVYFDGDNPDRKPAPPGISVRYSAPLCADEAIIQRLKEIRHPMEVIVVTNDRELANRCRDAGSKTMDWRQFTLKMKSRPATTHTGRNSHEPVDVDDWMRYFGLDESNI